MISPTKQLVGILRVFFSLATLEGLLTIAQLVGLPGGAERGLARLLSGRLLLLLLAALPTFALLWALFKSWRSPAELERLAARLASLFHRDWVYWGALVLGSLAFVACFYFLLLRWKDNDPYVRSYLLRLAPFALWMAFLSLQGLILVRWLRYGADLRTFEHWRAALGAASITFVLFLLLSGWMAWTKIPARWGA